MDRVFYDHYAWCLVHGPVISVDNMTELEVMESVLEDILIAHSHGITLRWYDLFRFLRSNSNRINRVLDALLSDTVYPLVVINPDDTIQIRPERVYMQMAMDVCGFWLEGYDPPEGTTIIRLSAEGETLINELGVEGAATSLYMDFVVEQGQYSNSVN